MSNFICQLSLIRGRMVVLVALVLAVLFGPAATICPAVTKFYETYAFNGQIESPINASPASGYSYITIDTALSTMRVYVTFSGLLGTATGAHFHAATTVANSGTAIAATLSPAFSGFPIGATSGSYDHTLDMTLASSYSPAFIAANGGTPASAFAALVAALDASKAYVDIHTSVFPAGEVRGFPVFESGACCTGSTCTYATGIACSGASSSHHFLGVNTLCNAAGNNSSPCCKADHDQNGALAVADVFAFLNDWFASNANTNFDSVNGLQVADIFAFLNAWFTGC